MGKIPGNLVNNKKVNQYFPRVRAIRELSYGQAGIQVFF